MMEPTDFTLPFQTQTNPDIFCPSCCMAFPSADAVVQHLSDAGQCGQWAVEFLPNLDGSDLPPPNDYSDDMDAAQDEFP
ncbi:hypothetical protein V8B97DRAFT_1983567 [Scleroderma yunnanense]